MVCDEHENELTVAATGDSIWTRHISVYDEERFLSLIKVLREADVAFTNCEMQIHDYKGFPGTMLSPTTVIAEPFVADEIKWAGFSLLSRANNHAMECCIEGMFATSEVLDKAGLVHAGVGRNLAEARAPAYLDTKKGRVALTSMDASIMRLTDCGHFTPRGMAGNARPDFQGRPGLNPLRHESYYVVDSKTIEEMKTIISKLGLKDDYSPPFWQQRRISCAEEFCFLKRRFVVGDEFGVRANVLESDVKGNLESIKDAKRQADLVLVNVHQHLAHKREKGDRPPEFIEQFARDCVDAGADIITMQGPHKLQGIEIYKDKPIFYSLGNFIYQNPTKRLPADAYEEYELGVDAKPQDYWDKVNSALHLSLFDYFHLVSVVALSTFRRGKLAQLKLYPIELGYGRPPHQIGRPMLTDNTQGKKIIDLLRKLSHPYGTQIEFDEGVGVAR